MMRLVQIAMWFLGAVTLIYQPKAMAQDLQVLVLDALDGNHSECEGRAVMRWAPSHQRGESTFTNDRGIAKLPYVCNEKQVIEIEVVPLNKKEQCGNDVNTNLTNVLSRGFISNPSAEGGIWCLPG